MIVLPRPFLALVAVALAPLAARAEAQSATASLSEATTEVGQPVEYRIEVVGIFGGNGPQTPQVPGLTLTSAGQGKSLSTDGGFPVATTTYVFNVEASHAGRFVIPGQKIDTGSGVVRVEPVTLTVGGSESAAPDPSRAVFAQIHLAKASAYVGELVPAEVRVYLGSNVSPVNIDPSASLNGDGFTTQKFTPPQQDVQTLNGAKYRVITYRTAIAGVKTGVVSVSLADLGVVVQVPRARPRRRSTLGNPFDDDPFFRDPFGGFNSMVARQLKLRTEPQAVEIKALPPRAPADFAGAVGHFNLESEADPRKAQAGDPITVRLHLSGDGNFDRVGAPAISDDRGLHLYPASAKFKADDALGLNGTKTFEQAVVSQIGRKELPAYRFSYLDPDSGKYVTLKTEPFAVTVEGPAAPAETPAPAPVAAAPSATPPPPPKPKDILYIRTDDGPPATFAPVYRRPGFWLTQGLIGAALALGGAVAWWRRRARNERALQAAETQRRQAELLKALKAEGTARRDFYAAAARLAQLRAGGPGQHLTAVEICAARGLDPQMTASLEQIFQRRDELAYSGGAVAQEPAPPEERRAVLATLETFAK